VIVDTDWDSIVWHSPNRERMSRILTAWEQHAADPYLPRTLQNKLARAGFQSGHNQVIPLLNSSYEANSFSNRIIDLIVPFVAGRNGITRDEAEAWAVDLRQTGSKENTSSASIAIFSPRIRLHDHVNMNRWALRLLRAA
jgi:arsenite methyltransferase